ncbi:MAG TPA: B12-binding domain-containing protein [Acidimicrobiales bacterium]|nr:B12-binding domain-containing protein [Acidimicrobiales bacterium]
MDLRTAAEHLGVHYQTAYRWVRSGALRAVKVGTSYEVEPEEIERVKARRSLPAPPPPAARVRRWDQQATRLYDALMTGDELAARLVVDRLHVGRVSTVDICEHMVVPVLRRIGEAWETGTVDLADEHRASAICARLLARIDVHPRGRPRGVVVVTTVPGEEHVLPSVMAAMALRADRWQVHHLGTQTPYKHLLGMARQEGADLVVLSVTYGPARGEAERCARRLRHDAGIRCLVGQPGASMAELVRLARGEEGAKAGTRTSLEACP